jgi:hypothetical protein
MNLQATNLFSAELAMMQDFTHFELGKSERYPIGLEPC